jgi:cytochrome c peroxidase
MKSFVAIIMIAVLTLGGIVLLHSCKHESISATTPLNFVIPPGFPAPTYVFGNNPPTQEGFLLGRKLFYDGRLSIDGNYPCSSCHQPDAAFTTFEHDRSHGYNHSHTLRNAPGLFNLAWNNVYTQDGSASNLESIYLKHITNPNEMAETMSSVINKIKNDGQYKNMFRAAFGDEHVTEDRIFKALTQFLINLVSADSKYDKVKRGAASFTQQEQDGYTVFQSKCTTCHAEPLFTDYAFRNTGLPVDPLLNDFGRMRVTGKASDSLKFRTPSLRNLELTSYYGHDGRYTLVRDMIHHYETGVQPGPTLDPSLSGGIPLTQTEENNLIFFLRTLSDSAFLNNPRNRE